MDHKKFKTVSDNFMCGKQTVHNFINNFRKKKLPRSSTISLSEKVKLLQS